MNSLAKEGIQKGQRSAGRLVEIFIGYRGIVLS